MRQLKSYDTLLNESFERIQSGKLHDEKLKPYEESFIWEMIYFFQRKEEYEKCQILKSKLDNYNHESNYNKWITQ